jgi:hypothetical protein
MGDLEGARAQLERALTVYEGVLGSTHLNVAISRSNLASVLQDTGDLEGARAQLEQALLISRDVYGPKHPTVLAIEERLASSG